MNNIFENAYFGKAYKTRDGRKVIFYMATKLGACLLSEKFGLQLYHFDGTSFMKCSKSDIVSEWQKEINEEELAKQYAENSLFGSKTKKQIAYCAYLKGYRKALNK